MGQRRYSDKVVVMAGAASGLGAAMTERFAAEGPQAGAARHRWRRCASHRLLDELDAGNRYIITHGNYRNQVAARHAQVMVAFDAMAAQP